MSIIAFIASVAAISLSGVLMPGPVFAVAVAKGHRSPVAGFKIGLGHVILELPVILLVYAGFGVLLETELAQLIVGIVGGLMLLWMGYGLIRSRADVTASAGRADRMGPVAAGVVASVANPYLFLWWATVGALLITQSLAFGVLGVVLLAAVHWLCDLGWNGLVSYTTFRSRRLWTPLVHRLVFTGCGLMLVGFGVYFVVSAALGT